MDYKKVLRWKLKEGLEWGRGKRHKDKRHANHRSRKVAGKQAR